MVHDVHVHSGRSIVLVNNSLTTVATSTQYYVCTHSILCMYTRRYLLEHGVTHTSGATEWSCGMTGRLRYMVLFGPPTGSPPSAVTAGRRGLYRPLSSKGVVYTGSEGVRVTRRTRAPNLLCNLQQRTFKYCSSTIRSLSRSRIGHYSRYTVVVLYVTLFAVRT